MDISNSDLVGKSIPWFGVRGMARDLQAELSRNLSQLAEAKAQLSTLGILPIVQLENMKAELERQVLAQREILVSEKVASDNLLSAARQELEDVRKAVVLTEEIALLQESGVYKYRHPLTDVVAYEKRLEEIESQVKEMTRKDGGAVTATTNWTVNGSIAAGRAMVRDFSKLMLRAFNAEADNLVRTLKPYKLDAAVERLIKVSDTIVKLGKTMDIRISTPYLNLRIAELELTADYQQKLSEQKDAERAEKERLREERKVQQEIERERARLEKERQHFSNALAALRANGDTDGVLRVEQQLADVDRAIESVDYRAANIRAGYAYLISNIGSFGERMVKVGMTRRLDPLERIRELSDASVPFNFDVHAVFFSEDAVGIELAMHERLANVRVNTVNRRREFFRTTPLEVKAHFSELAGEMLQFVEFPEALEYRQSLDALR